MKNASLKKLVFALAAIAFGYVFGSVFGFVWTFKFINEVRGHLEKKQRLPEAEIERLDRATANNNSSKGGAL